MITFVCLGDKFRTRADEDFAPVLTSKGVEEFLGEDKITAVMAGGEKIEADMFISAFGVREH